MMISPPPTGHTLDATDLVVVVAGLQRSIAEHGLDAGLWRQASAIGETASELARNVVEALPQEAMALLGAGTRLEAAEGMGGDEREDFVVDALDAIHIALLSIRENSPVAESVPVDRLVRWLTGELGVTQEAFAAALGVPARTMQRWLARAGAIPPSEERRLRLAVRGLNDLRFTLRGQLALDWLQAPLPGAGQRRPVELLDEPEAFSGAVMATRF